MAKGVGSKVTRVFWGGEDPNREPFQLPPDFDLDVAPPFFKLCGPFDHRLHLKHSDCPFCQCKREAEGGASSQT